MKRRNERSIRRQVLTWLLVPLGLIWIVSSAVAFYLAVESENEIFDLQLLNSADSVVARLRVKESQVYVDLPPPALAIMRHNLKDQFYYQVLSPDGKLIAGDAILPPPDVPIESREPHFRTLLANGQQLRAAAFRVHYERAPQHSVVIQVGETFNTRKMLAGHLLASMIIPDAIVFLLGVAAVSYGVARGLAPLRNLQTAVSSRSQYDLSALDEDDAPVEVRPLVHSVNDLMGRLREDLEAQRRFVANAAHQLRTPLAGLKTYIGFLKRAIKDGRARQVLEQLDTGADRTTHLVNRLLALAKAEPSSSSVAAHRVLDLNFVASDTTAVLVEEALQKNIDLSFDASDSPALIYGDVASLQEMVSNIVENGIRYTQAGGTVAVRVLDDETVRLAVEDNGPGIPPEERELVFERFYRILGTGIPGSGLGLSIVNEIARCHNARVLLTSGPGGVGTRVTVEFMKLPEADEIAKREVDRRRDPH